VSEVPRPAGATACPSLAAIEELHAAISFLEHDRERPLVERRVARARSLAADHAWVNEMVRELERTLDRRDRSDPEWKLDEEALRYGLQYSPCLPPDAHARMHENLRPGEGTSLPSWLQRSAAGRPLLRRRRQESPYSAISQ
jgi:hypothetical protein